MKTGFLYDDRYLLHQPGAGHPESAVRLEATLAYLHRCEGFSSLASLAPQLADERWITLVHSLDYLKRAQETCESGFTYLDTPDVGISPQSFEIAKLAAGGALELADQLAAGKIDNGFALLRPPGHHAEHEFAMGFCLFNNIAILARYLQKRHGFEKILILDWDVHHGNGTQHTFEEDPSVYYMSLHQYPFYPGTGAASETGIGRGRGATLNCPMTTGATDHDYRNAFENKILPQCAKFKPDVVLISAGFDAHAADPLASISLTTGFFGWMTEKMMAVASEFSKGRLLSLLEGGYNLQALPHCIATHLAGLSQNPTGFDPK